MGDRYGCHQRAVDEVQSNPIGAIIGLVGALIAGVATGSYIHDLPRARRSTTGTTSTQDALIADGDHRSANKHGVSDDDVVHAVTHEVVSVDLEPDADPPRMLVIGPDRSGNLLEVTLLVLDDDRLLAIHAMRLRRQYFEFLPGAEGSP